MHHKAYALPFNLADWLAENRALLVPPVSNKLLFESSSGMIVQMLGGGNQRLDFHDDPAQEFFYQLKGDMFLRIIEDGRVFDMPVREGEIFLLPAHVRHSPQRPDPESYGLVIEGARLPGQKDGFEWYCLECTTLVHRVEIAVKDIVADLPPLYEAFDKDEAKRRCPNCGAVHPGKTPPQGWSRMLA